MPAAFSASSRPRLAMTVVTTRLPLRRRRLAMWRPEMADGDEAVTIAVEGKADIGADRAQLLLQAIGMQRAAVRVDVRPVGLGGDRDHAGAESPEHARRHVRGRAVGAVDGDAHAGQV